MPLTKQELLKPRIRCVIDYPGNIFGVGKILQFTDKAAKEFSFSEEWFFIKDDVAWGKTFFDQYKDIFKKVEWWEERSPEDLEGIYVEDKDGFAFKVVSNDNFLKPFENNIIPLKFIHPINYHYTPITKEEYESYINQKQQ